MNKHLTLGTLVIAALALSGTAKAGELFWSGSGTWSESKWSADENGPFDSAWIDGESPTFVGTGGTVIVDGTYDIGDPGIGFDADGVILSGGTLVRTYPLINPPANPAYTCTINSILDGDVGLKVGDKSSRTGTLILGGANIYTGATTFGHANSMLIIANDTALGGTADGTTVPGGRTLALQGGITVGAEALSLAGTGISSGGALRNISGENTYGGPITLTGAARINSDSNTLTLDVASGDAITGTYALTFGGAGNITVADPIATGAGTLTKDGAGTLTLNGVNTYTGATTVSQGTLLVNGSTAAGSAVAVNDGGTLGGEGTIGGAVAVNDGGRLLVSPGGLDMSGDLGMTDAAQAAFVFTNPAVKTSKVTGGGSLTLAGTLNVDFSGGVYGDGWSALLFDGNFLSSHSGDFAEVTATGLASGMLATFSVSTMTLTLSLDVVPGDTNGDKVVDAADFITLKKNFNQPGAGAAQGNFTGADGFVDWEDLRILMSNMGPAGGAPSMVPEPCSAMLLVFGAAALFRRRKKA